MSEIPSVTETISKNHGNKCGHFPDAPRLIPNDPARVGKGGHPRVLTLAIERLDRYYLKPSFFPQLNWANGSTRQQRSERREACILMLRTLLKFTDLATLCVGTPTAEGFKAVSVARLASACGIGFRRAQRALSDLYRAKLVSSSQAVIRLADGSYEPQIAIRQISMDVFRRCGVSLFLKRQRAAAYKRLQEKARKFKVSVRHLVNMRKNQVPKPNRAEVPVSLNQLWAKLFIQHPDWTGEQIKAEAQRLLNA